VTGPDRRGAEVAISRLAPSGCIEASIFVIYGTSARPSGGLPAPRLVLSSP